MLHPNRANKIKDKSPADAEPASPGSTAGLMEKDVGHDVSQRQPQQNRHLLLRKASCAPPL